MAVIRFRRSSGSYDVPEEEPYQFNNVDPDDTDGEEQSSDEPDDEYDESEDFEEEMPEEDSSPLPHRHPLSLRRMLSILIRILILLCIVGGLSVLLLYQQNSRNYTTAEFRTTVPVTAVPSAQYFNADGILVSCSKDGASGMDMQGNTLWQISYEIQQPIVASRGSTVAVGGYGESRIYLVDASSGMTGTVSTNLPVRALSVSEKGYVAAILDDSDASWIYLFDSDGETVGYVKRPVGTGGYPTAIALSPDGHILACSQLVSDNMSIKTSVAFYNFGSVGRNSVDNCVSGYDYSNEVAPFLSYINGTTCVAATDQRVAFYAGSDIPTSISETLFTAELQGIWTGDGDCALLFPDSTGEEQYSLEMFNSSGKKTGTISFTMDFTDIILTGDRVIIHDGQKILIYSTEGEKRYEGSFGKTVLTVIPTSSASTYYLLEEGGLEEMVLR